MNKKKSEDFIFKHKNKLIELSISYLAGNLSHDEIREYAWQIVEDWSSLQHDEPEPYIKGEKAFWAVIWNIINLANKDHWNSGVTQKDLNYLLPFLKNLMDLPEGYETRRPTDKE